MQVTSWNIWHSYSSTIVGPLPDFRKWASSIVEANLGVAVVHRDGECWYRDRGHVQTASSQLGFTANKAEGRFTLPSNASDYTKECILQAATMRTHEQYVLSDPLCHIPTYIRVYFAPSILRYKQFSAVVYPEAKIYEDGILIMSLRILSPDTPYEIDAFVREQVNLYALPVIACELPIEVVARAISHCDFQERWQLWTRVSRAQRAHKCVLRQTMTTDEQGDYRFCRVMLSGEIWQLFEASGFAPTSMRELARIHEWALLELAAVANRRRWNPIRLKSKTRSGGFWSGRPSVYIAEMIPVVSNSLDLVEHHAESIARIMMKSVGAFRRSPAEIIGPNLREFEDYAVFANKGVTLWINLDNSQSLPIIESTGQPIADRNLREFVSSKQVQVEFVEYWYLAHRAVEEASLQPTRRLSDLARMRRRLAELDRSVEEAPPSGEIADLIRHIGTSLNVQGIAGQVRANLELREVVMQEARDRRNFVFGIVLTVMLSLTGAPALADSLVKPTFEILDWWRPHDEKLWSLWCLLIAVMLLIVLVLLAAVCIFSRRDRGVNSR